MRLGVVGYALRRYVASDSRAVRLIFVQAIHGYMRERLSGMLRYDTFVDKLMKFIAEGAVRVERGGQYRKRFLREDTGAM